MKIITQISSLTVLLLTILFYACKTNKKSEIVITSTKHKNTKAYLIASQDNIAFNCFSKAIDSSLIDNNGNVKFQFNQEESGFYQVKVKQGSKEFNLIYNVDLFINPGDTIEINIGDKVEVVDKQGLNELQMTLEKEYYNQNKPNDSKYVLGIKEHEDRLKLFIDNSKKIIAAYKQNHNLPRELEQYLNAKIKLREVNDNWDYLKYHNYYSGIGEGMPYLEKKAIPEQWNTTLDNTISAFNFIDIYKNYLLGYVNHHFEIQNEDLKDEDKWNVEFKRKQDFIKTELTGINKDMAFFALTDDFWKYLMISGNTFYKQAKDLEFHFANNHVSKKYYKAFSSVYAMYNKIAPGSEAPNFTLKNNEGKEVSLQDFKDKIVYLDFWGTWCGPCIKSIPDHLQLQEKYKGKEVTFLYVALESEDEGKALDYWKEFIQKKNFGGVHLIASKQFNNEAIAPYLVSAAPTYILIDKGRIAYPRAAKPSEISGDIDKLL